MITLQTGRPAADGTYVCSTDAETSDVRYFVILRWTGTSWAAGQLTWPRAIHGWAGPLAETPALEYDL